MEIRSAKSKIEQKQIAKELRCSRSTLQWYRQEKNTLSPYRTPPNSHKRKQKNSNTNLDDDSNREHDHKKTSNDVKRVLFNYRNC